MSELPTTNTRTTPLPPFTAAEALEQDLRSRIKGEVRFDEGSRALYATDSSNYRHVPIGVVIPNDEEDVIAAVAAARQHGAPVLARGCGTSLAGQCCNVAVILDMSKYMNRIMHLDPDAKTARVQPGLILDDLRNEAEKHRLTFGPDPATHSHCTLGGMIGNNSCGVHSVMAGKTVDNIDELDILTYDGLRMKVGRTSDTDLERIIREGGRRGEIYGRLKALRDKYADLIRKKYPKIPRRVSGYNLDELLPENGFNVARALVGSESTCVVILEAVTRLVDSPPARSLLVLGYPDIYSAGDHVPVIMEHHPIALEAVDDRLVDYMKRKGLHPEDVSMLPGGKGWLLVEFGGKDKKESDGLANKLMEKLKKDGTPPEMKLYDNLAQEKMLWKVRESGLGATAIVPGMPNTWPGWEDSAVAPDKVGPYLRELRALFDRYNYGCALYGHFGQGCIHVRIDFDLETEDGIKKFTSFLTDAASLVVKYGGSLSGEHGDGQARAAMLPIMYGDELIQAFREFKSIWDPDWKMNPGKIVDAFRPDEGLRIGAQYNPWNPSTVFEFPGDNHSFSHAALRCVGVGDCRRLSGGVMCPSFMATREEKHSTRGRARLLFEMLERKVIGKNGWHDESVKEALDLCLACKGCKGDCPVNVDMATYKSEFLSHYYKGHIRPRSAYAFGLIHRWSRLASIAPGIANFLTQSPGLRSIAKAIAGMAPDRSIPRFAAKTFQKQFQEHRSNSTGGSRVILWPDTFNNHFHPDSALAAVRVLEGTGFQVVVPEGHLCCGRPLYDWGMLDTAKDLLRDVLRTLRHEIREGTPVVVLEPSCASVFRDELINLFPADEDAMRLSKQTVLLSEFLCDQADASRLPTMKGKAVVHGHCHHHAIMKMTKEEQILKQVGLEYSLLDSGCCGMAGSFGFEKGERYDVSVKVGERVLLPAVRSASPGTLIIADGFSCREQISQGTGKHALHLAEVLDMGMRKSEY